MKRAITLSRDVHRVTILLSRLYFEIMQIKSCRNIFYSRDFDKLDLASFTRTYIMFKIFKMIRRTKSVGVFENESRDWSNI